MINFGLVGRKLGHSYSQIIHTFIFKKLGINGQYTLIEIPEENSGNILGAMEEKKIKGFNITIPYKEVILGQVDIISREGTEIGAINTVLIKGGKSYGYNTDYFGVLKMLEELSVDVKNKKCYILGTGGGAKAVIVALKNLGAREINVVSRNIEKGKKLRTKFPYINIVKYENIGEGELIINATPVGMFPDADKCPIKKEVFEKFNYAADLVYNPQDTLFIKYAQEMGLKAINGLSMLVEQGIKAEEIWQNKKIGNSLYEEVLEYLGGIL